jgi:predicted alpha/beta hydrolase
MTGAVRWLPVEGDGHRWEVMCIAPPSPQRVLVWLPALGVPARNYEAFARALAEHGVAVVVHEWRGFGSSSMRASRECDWGYRDLLHTDIPATREAASRLFAGLPSVLGGHSLGGQLATCSLAIAPGSAQALWLVASGAPYFRAFPWAYRAWLPLAYRLLAALARAFGALPGRRIGFGGQEARSVIRDWSRTALTGVYAAPGIGDLEPRLRRVDVPVRAVLLSQDWLAPAGSLDFLLGKLASTSRSVHVLAATQLGARADHFRWMRTPGAVAAALAD